MIKFFKNKIKRNFEIFTLVFLIFFTIISTSYFNYSKKINDEAYNNFVDNIYLKKTLSHLVENLEPKYKKVKHKIRSGETFDKILEKYSIDKIEILKLKKVLQKKVNLNKLNTKQIIQFSIDKTNNKIKEFTIQVSNTQKINLTRDFEKDNFNERTLLIKLNKEIIYKEDVILQS